MRSPDPRSALRLRLLRVAARGLGRVDSIPAKPRRVLLIRPDHIGDVLLSSPAVGLLRSSLPDAHLTYLIGPWSRESAERGPPVDRVRTLAFPGFERRPKPNALQPYALLVREAQRLRRERYDMAVVLRPDHWWGALLALSAGIQVRVGARTAETEPLVSHCATLDPQAHAVTQTLQIARLALDAAGSPHGSAPGITFSLSPRARTDAETLWASLGLHGLRVVALHPNAGAPLKQWPAARWQQLAQRLRLAGFGVLFSGAPSEQAQLQALANGGAVAAGQSLEVSGAMFQRCALLVAPDCGAAHLAGTVGTPTLRLYGPAPPSVFGPWPPDEPTQQVLITGDLACTPCGYLANPPCGARTEPACMLALGVEDVANAALRLLNQS